MAFNFGAGGTNARGSRSFMSSSAQVPDPLADVEYTGNVETDAASELDALAEGFRARKAAEDQRFMLATDTEYWFAVCFRDRDTKEAFLRALKIDRLGDKYVDGHQLAKLLGVDLP